MRILVVSDLPSGRQRFVDDSILALRDSGNTVATISLRCESGFENGSGLNEAQGLGAIQNSFSLSFFEFIALLTGLFPWAIPGTDRFRFIRSCANFDILGIKIGAVRAMRYVRAVKAIASFSPDVIHVHFAWNLKHVTPISTYLRIPIVVTAHGSDILKREEWKRDLCRKEIAGIACVSKHIKERIDQASSLSDKTAFVPNCISQVFCAQPAPSPTSISVLCVASLRILKNHQWLIRALSKLKRNGIQFHCTLVGEPLRGEEAHADGLKRQIIDEGLSDVIHFSGWLDEGKVVELMDRATVCVLPSTSEGLPVCVIEAMSRARCTVVSDIPGCREAIEDGSYGVLVPLNDDDGLCKGIIDAHRITTSETGRMALARDHVMKTYSPEAHARALIALFHCSSAMR